MMEKLGQAKTHLELKKMIAEVDTNNSGRSTHNTVLFSIQNPMHTYKVMYMCVYPHILATVHNHFLTSVSCRLNQELNKFQDKQLLCRTNFRVWHKKY